METSYIHMKTHSSDTHICDTYVTHMKTHSSDTHICDTCRHTDLTYIPTQQYTCRHAKFKSRHTHVTHIHTRQYT